MFFSFPLSVVDLRCVHIVVDSLWTDCTLVLRQMFGLFPHFHSWELCCYERYCISFCLNTCFQLFVCVPRFILHRLCVNSVFIFLKNCQTVFHSGCNVTCPLAVYYGSTFCIFFSNSLVSFFFHFFFSFCELSCFDNSHSNGCEVVPHWFLFVYP